MKRFNLCTFFVAVTSIFFNIYAGNSSKELTEDQKGAIEQAVKYKVDDFISYLPDIAATSNKGVETRRLAKRYMAQALKLFIGEGQEYPYADAHGNERMHAPVTMQTTSRGIKNKPKRLTTYLNRLMALPYHRVEVEKCEAVKLCNDIHKIGENKWTCTAYFIQTFRAYNKENGCIIYDKDPKKVTVYITCDSVFNAKTGELNEFYAVQLGDISIYSDYNYK